MRFLANENFPLPSVLKLREAGHDVAYVLEDSPGQIDPEVMARCHSEERVLLTFDRDYGELIFHRRMPSPRGVVYFRFVPNSPVEPAEVLLVTLLLGQYDLEGRFTLIQRNLVRQRQLPT
jgi:predicted nuclease of predicted toxin-antitoxin system